MKKSAFIAIIILIATVIAGSVFFFTSEPDFDNAISKYEKGNYTASIKIINHLLKSSDYEKSEKMFYYRNMSLNRLIEKIEADLKDEITRATLNNTDKNKFLNAKKEIEDELSDLNRELGSDLVLAVGTSKSTIISGGKFYNEFISKYSGSTFVEELDFHEMKKNIVNNPVRFIDSVKRFYNKFPNSAYMPQIVEMIFSNFSQGVTSSPDNEIFLKELISKFAVKYPTSQEVSRIFISQGENVNLRNSPGLTGKTIGKTADGEMLIQLDKSMDTMQIGDTRSYWYKVTTLRGQNGWIFGKFLKPVEIEKLHADNGTNETLKLDENFTDWKDSNTPSKWSHIEGGATESIGFKIDNESKILYFNEKNSRKSGLFSRYRTGQQFSLQIKARFVSGTAIDIVKTVNEGRSYTMRLTPDSSSLNGRTVPVPTGTWHTYEFTVDSNGYAVFKIDGNLLSARIESVKESGLNDGLYLLNHRETETAECLVEFLKIK